MPNSTASRVRLLAVDLDGTLLTSARDPHPESAAALRRAQAAGVVVVLASGRCTASVRAIAREIGLAGPVVGCNGAHVVGADDSELLHLHLTADVRDAVLDYVGNGGPHLNVYCRDEVYYADEGPWEAIYRTRVQNVNPQRVEATFLRGVLPTKMLLMDDPARIPLHRRALLDRLLGSEFSTTVSEPEYLEFLPASANKGLGLQVVAHQLGMDRAEVAAIGDYANDLEMLRWVGTPGAVANASEPVLEAATLVVRSNDEGGVADFVDRIV